MEPIDEARREAALEIQKLADDFEKEDEAAFRRTRVACWVVLGIVTIIILGLLMIGGDGRYLGVLWVVIVGLTFAAYAFSSRRQRHQTDRLRAIAGQWLNKGPSVSGGRVPGSGVSSKNDVRER